MTGIAFYAPLKSPDHPTPSGDRQVARNLMVALETGLSKPVTLMSELRSFETRGHRAAQADLIVSATAEIARLSAMAPHPKIWVTYHNYYKAPDLVGPSVARAWGVPYVLIEATRAKSRLTGPWADFASRAEAASDAAQAIFHFTEQDRFALERDRVPGQIIAPLAPFLNMSTLPDASDCSGPMLTAGMMRQGDKLASYSLIAQALALLRSADWRLDIVGDGPARAEVDALFAPFGNRVRLLGAMTPEALTAVYQTSGLFLWPGVNEAFGMVYLEAQAAGLPVVAQDRPGVRDVLLPGTYPALEAGPLALAKALDAFLADPTLCRLTGQKAQDHIANRHLLPQAATTLRDTLLPLMEGSR